ncbi:hypothetical protein ABIF76_006127 [Bradyrhizobium ottawaense]
MFMPAAPSDNAATRLRPVRHAAGGDEGDLQFLRRARQQDHVGNVVLAGMTAALEAVDADGIAADPLGLE